MANRLDSDSTRQSDRRGGRRASGIDVTRIFAGGTIGALLGGICAWFFREDEESEEPPIRVKGGSLYVELLSRRIQWKPEQQDDKKNWKLSKGKNCEDEFGVSIRVAAGGQCASVETSGKKVKVTHQSASVELKVTGNHTKLKSSVDLSLSADGRTLSYDGPGPIQKIEVDGTTVFQHGPSCQLDEMVLLNC